MLWIPITIGAAGFQVARNALQRGLMGDAGPWGATLVRFLFGLPFSLALWAVVAALSPGARPNFSLVFWLAASTGAMSQLLASAALLVAMRRAGFAIGTALQQSSLPLSAVIGLVGVRRQSQPLAWVGVAITTPRTRGADLAEGRDRTAAADRGAVRPDLGPVLRLLAQRLSPRRAGAGAVAAHPGRRHQRDASPRRCSRRC